MSFRVDERVNTKVLTIANGTSITDEYIPIENVVALSFNVPTTVVNPLFLVALNDAGVYVPVIYQNEYVVFDTALLAGESLRWVVDFAFFGAGTRLKLRHGTTLTDPTAVNAGADFVFEAYITYKAGP